VEVLVTIPVETIPVEVLVTIPVETIPVETIPVGGVLVMIPVEVWFKKKKWFS